MSISDKSTPNQMREFMKRIREGEFVQTKLVVEQKEMGMREMLKITRKLNESNDSFKEIDLKSATDQNDEEQKFRDYFKDMSVNIRFIDLEVYNDFIFWGGTVNGIIQFAFKVTPDESTSGVEFNYLEDFSPDNPENEEVINRIESYFDNFYRYWVDNVISTNTAEEVND